MSGQGFGKFSKSKFARVKKYTFSYRSSDGCLNLLEIESASRDEAIKEFERFVRDLEFSLRVAGGLG
jgi:hypothetical protein